MKKLLALLALLVLTFGMAQEMETIENPFVYPAEWSVDAPDGVQMGGQFHGASISDFSSFNPFTVAESPDLPNNMMAGVSRMQGGLIRRDPITLDWVPYMATGYEFSEDNKSITFQLREGMRFSDGEEITAEDFVATWKIHTDPDVGSNSYSNFFIDDQPVTVEALGEYELKITFPVVTAEALGRSSFTPWPAHVFMPVYEAEGAQGIIDMWQLSDDVTTFVSPGPYVAVDYLPGERAVFERNPYFGTWNVDEAGNPLPYLEGATVTVAADLNSWLALYLAGEVDQFDPTTVDQLAQIQSAIDAGNLDASLVPQASAQASSLWIVFNWNHADNPFKQELFRNPLFRQAMSHLADRAAMVELVYGGLAQPTYSSVYPVFEDWLSPNLPTFPFDLEEAANKLAAIGFDEKDSEGWLVNDEGQRLEFNLVTNAGNNEREQAAQIFADTAAEIGVKVNFQPIDFQVLVDQLLTQGPERGFDAILLGLTGGGLDFPFGSNVIPCGTNLHAFNYPADGECLVPNEILAERLYLEGVSTLDLEARQKIGYELQNAWAQIQGFIYLVGPSYNPSWNNRLGGNYPIEEMSAIKETDVWGQREPATTYIK